MHTLHDAYAARLVAADQARRNRELREQIEHDEAHHRPLPTRMAVVVYASIVISLVVGAVSVAQWVAG